MQTNGKVGEASMDDILASIRKIIAEEPQAMPAPPPEATPPVHQAAAAPTPVSRPVAERRGPADLERELAELLREPTEPVPARSAAAPVSPQLSPQPTAPPRAAEAMPSPAALAPAPAAAAPTAAPVTPPPERAANAGGLGSWLRNRAGAAAATTGGVEPKLEIPAASPASASGAGPSLAAAPAVNGGANGAAPGATLQSVLARLGSAPPVAKPSSVTGSAPVPGPVLSRPFTADRAQVASPVDAVLDAPANRVPEPAKAAISWPEANAEPIAGPSTVEPVSAPASVSQPMPTVAPPEPAVIQPAQQLAAAVPDVAVPSAVAPAAVPDPESVAVAVEAPVVAREVEAAPEAMIQPVMQPVAAEAVQPVSQIAPAPAPPSAPMAASILAAAVAPLAVAPFRPAGQPEVKAGVGTAVRSVEGQAPAATGSAAAPTNPNLDDALTVLLRPVVRQWLDENMTRALEKAVRLEMTDIVKSAMTKLGAPDKG